uniref:Olfactory receptor n=1 Tax=Anolis carolinensis TaxID=28377 RepID=H9GW18_ANOCA|nr:PREDICTED: olfactory receptor 4K3-like [Anolis carolinensis]|eukprot:XP_003223904.1 PREDICTED: olfactory receptor 4K3-like [Anolis carolinensis]
MAWENKTEPNDFILLGFSQFWEVRLVLFIIFLLLYMATLFSNILVLLAIFQEPRLFNSPMFFLLGHLAFLDLGISSFAMPRALVDFLTQHQVISFQGCMAQLFFLHLFGGSEMILLMFMAYDRYVAICHPLHYASRMSRHHCIGFVLIAWSFGLLHTSVQLGFAVNIPFCGSNHVDSFFCDMPLLIKLACMDTYLLEVMMAANNGILTLVSLAALLLSYGLILYTICSRGTPGGTSKAISTCTSHLIVVSMYFGPIMFIYLQPNIHSLFDKVLSVFYTSVTPFMNPTVYALKNKEMKAAMRKLLTKRSGVFSTQIVTIQPGGLFCWKPNKKSLPLKASLNPMSLTRSVVARVEKGFIEPRDRLGTNN